MLLHYHASMDCRVYFRYSASFFFLFLLLLLLLFFSHYLFFILICSPTPSIFHNISLFPSFSHSLAHSLSFFRSLSLSISLSEAWFPLARFGIRVINILSLIKKYRDKNCLLHIWNYACRRIMILYFKYQDPDKYEKEKRTEWKWSHKTFKHFPRIFLFTENEKFHSKGVWYQWILNIGTYTKYPNAALNIIANFQIIIHSITSRFTSGQWLGIEFHDTINIFNGLHHIKCNNNALHHKKRRDTRQLKWTSYHEEYTKRYCFDETWIKRYGFNRNDETAEPLTRS